MLDTIIALDVGAQITKAAMAYKDEDGALQILGYGVANTSGFANGCVQDMDELSKSIYNAIDNLQEKYEVDINPFEMPIFYSISGDSLNSRNIQTEMRRIKNIDQETQSGKVSQEDIKWLKTDLETYASNILVKDMRQITIIPQCYQIDNEAGIKNPNMMYGKEIKAAGLFITDNIHHILNLECAIEKALSEFDENIQKSDLKLVPIAASIASAMAVLNDDYNEIGVAILDIGKDCCDLAVYYQNFPILIWSQKFAGAEITKEIKKFLTIPSKEAEEIKKKYACAAPQKAGRKETIEVSGNRMVSLESLAQWVNEPVRNMFENVDNVLGSNFDGSTYKSNISQILITGGTANLKEIALVGQEVLELPVKIATPDCFKVNEEFKQMNDDVSFATLMGLCIYGTQDYSFEEKNTTGKKPKKKNVSKVKSQGNFVDKMKKSFGEIIESVKNIKLNVD